MHICFRLLPCRQFALVSPLSSHGYSHHDDVIKCKHFPRYWPFVRGIHRWPVNSPHKGQWRGALMFSLIFAWMNGWVNNGDAGDLRHHRAHYDVNVLHSWIKASNPFAMLDRLFLYWYYVSMIISSICWHFINMKKNAPGGAMDMPLP